jgi:hypothetical protein
MIRITLTDAGARSGNLWISCPRRLEVDEPIGLVAGVVGGAGRNVSRVAITARKRGQPQSVTLRVPGA